MTEEKAVVKKKESKKAPSPRRDRRKLIRRLIWFIFILLVFGCGVSIIRTVRFEEKLNNVASEIVSSVAAQNESEEAAEESRVNIEGAKLVATDFIWNYYTWGYGDDKAAERQERLAPYLSEAFDGLALDNVPYKSAVSSVRVWEVEEMSPETCKVTIAVSYTLKKQVEKETTVDQVNEAGEPYQETITETVEEEAGKYERYVSVPLWTDGRNFVVSGVPIIEPAPDAVQIPVVEMEKKEGKVLEQAMITEVETFCNTFLKVLTSGTQEELNYYLESNTELRSLTGIYSFETLSDLAVYAVENGLQIEVMLQFKELTTEGTVSIPACILLQKQADHYIVTDVKYERKGE